MTYSVVREYKRTWNKSCEQNLKSRWFPKTFRVHINCKGWGLDICCPGTGKNWVHPTEGKRQTLNSGMSIKWGVSQRQLCNVNGGWRNSAFQLTKVKSCLTYVQSMSLLRKIRIPDRSQPKCEVQIYTVPYSA